MLSAKNWLIYLVLAAGLLSACQQQQRPPTVVKLNGRVFKYTYGADIYKMEFINDSVLRWTGIAGKMKGKDKTESYQQKTISADTVSLSWTQDNQTKIKQQLNFKDNTVSTHIKTAKDSTFMTGKLWEYRRF